MARRVAFMRKGFLKLTASVASAVLTALGVSSCGTAADPTAPCYGVIAVEMTVDGTVRTARDSTAIPGIQVRLSTVIPSDTTVIDSVTSGLEGQYFLNFIENAGDGAFDDYYLRIQAQDIDSIEQGLFADMDTMIRITPDSVLDDMVDIDLNFFMEEIH